jgi:peptide/nickel transport system permease protein
VAFIYRRLVFYAIALWASITLNFLLPRLMPGNPILAFRSQNLAAVKNNPHVLDSLRVMLGGSKDPMLVQYVHYLGNLLHGDFGVSFSQYPTRVSDILGATVPWTLFLGLASTVIAFVLGTLLGIMASWRRNGVVDSVVTPLTMFAQSFPAFFLAMLLLYVFGFIFGWFPLEHAYGQGVTEGFNLPFLEDVMRHAALPLVAILLFSLGGWLLGMRNVMINTLSEDYVVMAQAKGLPDRRVMFMYAARNAMLPQVTSFAISIAYVLTGLVLIEDVFSYPGVGYTLVNAVHAQDYSLVQALLLLISVAVLAANLIADLLYVKLDPRVTET